MTGITTIYPLPLTIYPKLSRLFTMLLETHSFAVPAWPTIVHNSSIDRCSLKTPRSMKYKSAANLLAV